MAHKHREHSHSIHTHKPAGHLRIRTPAQLQLRRRTEPQLASTQAVTSELPATRNISCNAYQTPSIQGPQDLIRNPETFYRLLAFGGGFSPFTLTIVSTYLNAAGQEKLLKTQWLISAILVKFNHLGGTRGAKLRAERVDSPSYSSYFFIRWRKER